MLVRISRASSDPLSGRVAFVGWAELPVESVHVNHSIVEWGSATPTLCPGGDLYVVRIGKSLYVVDLVDAGDRRNSVTIKHDEQVEFIPPAAPHGSQFIFLVGTSEEKPAATGCAKIHPKWVSAPDRVVREDH